MASSAEAFIMDEATADLILSLQLQDLTELQGSIQGQKSDDSTVQDAGFAMALYRDEMRSHAAQLRDHLYGVKIGEADDPDRQTPSLGYSATPTFDQALEQAFSNLALNPEPGDGNAIGYSTDSNNSSVFCCVCNCECSEWQLIRGPCGDGYCKTDIQELFELSIKDESLFPPRCCGQSILLDAARPLLTSEQQLNFEQKSLELNTIDRVYCFDTMCGKFIPPAAVDGEKATCSACNKLTCAICKSEGHKGDCPKDPAYEALMATAAELGFQTCPRCHRLVELNFGCNHMTYMQSIRSG